MDAIRENERMTKTSEAERDRKFLINGCFSPALLLLSLIYSFPVPVVCENKEKRRGEGQNKMADETSKRLDRIIHSEEKHSVALRPSHSQYQPDPKFGRLPV